MPPFIEPTPGNNLGRGAIAGIALTVLGMSAIFDARGNPRVLCFGALLVGCGSIFFLEIWRALRRGP
jgi:hypothetical protein